MLELNYYWHYCLALEDFLFVNMSDFDPLKHTDDDLAVQEAKPKLKKPPLYKVILLNVLKLIWKQKIEVLSDGMKYWKVVLLLQLLFSRGEVLKVQ